MIDFLCQNEILIRNMLILLKVPVFFFFQNLQISGFPMFFFFLNCQIPGFSMFPG